MGTLKCCIIFQDLPFLNQLEGGLHVGTHFFGGKQTLASFPLPTLPIKDKDDSLFKIFEERKSTDIISNPNSDLAQMMSNMVSDSPKLEPKNKKQSTSEIQIDTNKTENNNNNQNNYFQQSPSSSPVLDNKESPQTNSNLQNSQDLTGKKTPPIIPKKPIRQSNSKTETPNIQSSQEIEIETRPDPRNDLLNQASQVISNSPWYINFFFFSFIIKKKKLIFTFFY